MWSKSVVVGIVLAVLVDVDDNKTGGTGGDDVLAWLVAFERLGVFCGIFPMTWFIFIRDIGLFLRQRQGVVIFTIFKG